MVVSMGFGNGPFGPLVLVGREVIFLGVDKLGQGRGRVERDRVVTGGMGTPAQQGDLAGLVDADHQVMIFIDNRIGGSGDGAVFGLGVETVGKAGDNDDQHQGQGRGYLGVAGVALGVEDVAHRQLHMALDGLMDVDLTRQAGLDRLAGEVFHVENGLAVRGVGHGHPQDGLAFKPQGEDLVFVAEVAREHPLGLGAVFLLDVDNRQVELGGQGFQELIAGDRAHLHQNSPQPAVAAHLHLQGPVAVVFCDQSGLDQEFA